MKTISIKTIGFLFFLSLFSFLSCSKSQDEVLTLVPEGEKIIIEALPAGYSTISQAKDVFPYAGTDIEYRNINNEQKAKKETIVNIYESKKGIVSFSQVFNPLNEDLNKLCLTQGQVVNFCRKKSQHLCQGGPTFFLIKENDEFLIIKVHSFANGLIVAANLFDDNDGLSDISNYRLVVPAI